MRTALLILATLLLAFWVGMRVERIIARDRCLDAGGAMRGDGLCTDVR